MQKERIDNPSYSENCNPVTQTKKMCVSSIDKKFRSEFRAQAITPKALTIISNAKPQVFEQSTHTSNQGFANAMPTLELVTKSIQLKTSDNRYQIPLDSKKYQSDSIKVREREGGSADIKNRIFFQKKYM